MKMSYDVIGNTRIRENGRKVDIFVKVDQIKQDIKTIIPEIESDKLLPMMSHCKNYYYGKLYYGRKGKPNRKKRKLTHNEMVLYEYLLKNKLNPCTTYRWFLATRIPEDVKDKLRQGKISQRKAMEISANRKKARIGSKGTLIIEQLRILMDGL
jgi:hypothetical protein